MFGNVYAVILQQMRFGFHILVLTLLVANFALSDETVTPEERKAEFAKPRGLSKSSSSSSSAASGSSSSSNTAQPSASSNSGEDAYSKMGTDFSKQMDTLSKSFTLPAIKDEPDYLKDLGKASQSLDSAGDGSANSASSLVAQYTEAFLATLQEMTQMQIQYELSNKIQKMKAPMPEQAIQKKDHDPSTPNSIYPSPISLRTRISSTDQGTSRGLFSKELDSLSAKAYNPPK